MIEKKDNKKKIIILGVITLVILALATTFSFFVWNSKSNQDIDVALSLNGLDAYINYNKGTDVLTGTLLPSADYTGGISTEIELWKSSSAASRTIYGHLYMDITTIGTNLATEPALKWAITSNGEVLNTGDFVGKAQGNSIELKLNIPLSTTKQLFQIYIWLDESMEINDAIEGETLSTKVRAEASEVIYAQNASEFITSLLASNPDTMNNDDPDGNVRYMGANPNNYVDIGDKYPEGFTVGKWEELGAPFQTADECKAFFNCSTNYGDIGFSSEAECNTELPDMLEEQFGVSSVEEFNNTYCVVEDKSNEKILWRIIGVFDVSSTDGGPTEKRLKIIRNESLGNMAWDSSNVNNWSQASLQEYLNGDYYNSIDSTSQSLIGDTYWNLGGTANYTSATNGLASHFYGYERGTIVYNGRPTYWIGKIGLMYPSDYGYATSGGTTTNRASCLAKEMYNWDSYSDCKNNDYLYNSSSSQWTLAPGSRDSDSVFRVNRSGSVNSSNVTNSFASRPVLYLKSTVQITGGDGTSGNPFTLN